MQKNQGRICPNKNAWFCPFVRREEREKDMQVSTTTGRKKGGMSRIMLHAQCRDDTHHSSQFQIPAL